jgi:hypothetical protein
MWDRRRERVKLSALVIDGREGPMNVVIADVGVESHIEQIGAESDTERTGRCSIVRKENPRWQK